jgi:hypothetical protein
VPGAHEVFLKLDWCRSPKLALDVAGGQRAKVSCAAGGNLWMTFFDVIFRPTRYIRAEVASGARRVPIGDRIAEPRWYSARSRGCSSVW